MKFYHFFLCALFLGGPFFLRAASVAQLWSPQSHQAFFLAVGTGDHKKVQSLLESGFLIGSTNGDKRTGFYVAVQFNRVKVLEVLLRFKGDINLDETFFNEKLPLLHYAVSLGHLEIAKLLIEAGASPSASAKKQNCVQKYLNYRWYFFDNLSPLQVAFLFKHEKIIDYFLFELGLPLPGHFNADLSGYANKGKLSMEDVVEILKDPLFILKLQNYRKILASKTFKEKMKENHLRKAREKKLLTAARVGSSEEFIQTLDEGSLESCFQEGWHPLHIAVLQDQEEVLSLLVERGGVSPDVKGPGGITALHLAAHFGKTSILCKLVALGASMDERTKAFPLGIPKKFKIEGEEFLCPSQSSALSLAVHAKNEEAVAALAEAGAGGSDEAKRLLALSRSWSGKDPRRLGIRNALRQLKSLSEQERNERRDEFREKEKAREAFRSSNEGHGGSKEPSAPQYVPEVPYASQEGGGTSEDPVEGEKVGE